MREVLCARHRRRRGGADRDLARGLRLRRVDFVTGEPGIYFSVRADEEPASDVRFESRDAGLGGLPI